MSMIESLSYEQSVALFELLTNGCHSYSSACGVNFGMSLISKVLQASCPEWP